MLNLENMPQGFYQPNLNADNPVLRIQALDRSIAAATEWEATLVKLLDDVTAEWREATEEAKRRPHPHTHGRVNELDECIAQIHQGVHRTNFGIHESIAHILHKPGLDKTRAFIEDAKEEREAAIRLRDEPQVNKPYRLKRGMKHVMRGPDDQIVHSRGGDVVELTPHQARMWADKFEPVNASDPKKTTTVEDDDEPEVEHTTEKQLRKRAGK